MLLRHSRRILYVPRLFKGEKGSLLSRQWGADHDHLSCGFVNPPHLIGYICQSRGGNLFDGVLVGLDHLLDHLPTDRAGLLGGQVTVVALLEVNANLICSLHLELVHCFSCLGYDILIACHGYIHPFVLHSNLYRVHDNEHQNCGILLHTPTMLHRCVRSSQSA